MHVTIEVLSIGSPDGFGDRPVAFGYELGTRIFQIGQLVEMVHRDFLLILPSLLADCVNCTRPPDKISRWL